MSGLAVLSGVLLILSFPNFNFSLLPWVALIPLLYIVRRASAGRAFSFSFLTGFVFFLGTIFWLTNVTVPGYIFLSGYSALYFGVFGLLAKRILESRICSGRLAVIGDLMVPALWVALEYIRTHLFTGFGWALLGYSQYKNLYSIQVADIAGPYAVSFLIVLINVAVFRLFFARRELRVSEGITVAAIVSAVILYSAAIMAQEFPGVPVRLSVVQGGVALQEVWDPGKTGSILDKLEELTLRAAEDAPDLIIWSETPVARILGEKVYTARVKEMARKAGCPILIGCVTIDRDKDDVKYYNSAAVITKDGAIGDIYDKSHLVPLGEYIPFETGLGWLRRFIPDGFCEYSAGEGCSPLRLPDTPYVFGVLICYEDIFPELAAAWAAKGAHFIVNMTNDSWFGEGGEQWQHASASVFRAIETRLPVIRAANNGVSCFIDPKGRIVSFVGEGEGSVYSEGFLTRDF